MRVWVTRTRPAAARTAARLHDLGLDALIDPVLEPFPLHVTLDLKGFDALAFTSGNAVRAYADLTSDRSLPAYAVGPATAAALKGIGFSQVRSADGDVVALAALLAKVKAGRVLSPGPADPAGHLPDADGVTVQRLAVYETRPLTPDAARAAADLGAVLIHSGRAAEAVAERAPRVLADLRVFAISEAAAAPLRDRPQRGVFIAPFPDEPSLLKLCADTLSETP